MQSQKIQTKHREWLLQLRKDVKPMPNEFMCELEDEESVLKDVTLVGSDGGHVRASKALLAIRSPVFRQMFFGNFRESKKDSVEMIYTTRVLQQIIQYCYINRILLEHRGDEEVVQVLDAANYFGLTELHSVVSFLVSQSRAEYTFDILQRLINHGLTGGEPWASCMEKLRDNADLWTREPTEKIAGIGGISIDLLEMIFHSPMAKGMPAQTLVKSLKVWNKAQNENSVTDEERARLQKLADDIDLRSIPMSDLVCVQPCPLYSRDRLHSAMVSVGKKEFEPHPLVSQDRLLRNAIASTVEKKKDAKKKWWGKVQK